MAIAVYVSVATVISMIKAGQLIRKTYHISDGAQVSLSPTHSRFTLESKMKHTVDCLSEAGSDFQWNDGQSISKKKRLQNKHSLLSGANFSITDKTKSIPLTWFNNNEYSLPFLLQRPPLREVLHHLQDPVKYKAKSYLIFQTLHGRRFERNWRKFHTGWMNLQIYLFSLRSS